MPEVDPSQLSQIGAQMAVLADQMHGAVNEFGQPTGPPGFACSAASAALWTGVRPFLLASGALVAQFGDDLTGCGSSWRDADAASAERFQSPETR